MKNYLLLFLLLPFTVVAQKQDTLGVKKLQDIVVDKVVGTDTTWKFNFPTIAQLNALATTVGTVTNTVNTINGITTLQGQSIKDLQITVAGLPVVVKPLPKPVSTSTYTLTEADNNGVLYCTTACTITVPVLSAGFTCSVIRETSGAVRFVPASGITITSAANYKSISIRGGVVVIRALTNTYSNLDGRLAQ